jgi:ubiquinone/menaquinone biosynthesis C-methylase UbiE
MIADLGCGTGILSKVLTECGHIVYGFDVSDKLLKVAAKKSGKNFSSLVSDISNLPIMSNSFDGAISFTVLDQIEDLEKVMDEVVRVLKPGGLFLFDISPFPTFDFWYFLGLYGIKGFTNALRGLFRNQSIFEWSVQGDDGRLNTINIYRYKLSYIEEMLQQKGFRVIGTRGVHISKMFIPEKVHVDGESEILSKLDCLFWRFDNYLNRFCLIQKNALCLLYAVMKI